MRQEQQLVAVGPGNGRNSFLVATCRRPQRVADAAAAASTAGAAAAAAG